MAQYQVPQYIEVEDKVIGPLTLKQFFYILGGGGIVFILYLLGIKIFFLIILAIPILSLALSLAFVKINNRSFLIYLQSLLSFVFKPRRYLWKK